MGRQEQEQEQEQNKCIRKHPAVKKAGKTILMSDLESDPLIMLQHNHYMKCFFLAAFVIPTLVPHLCWGESLSTAYFLAVLRLVKISRPRIVKHTTNRSRPENSPISVKLRLISLPSSVSVVEFSSWWVCYQRGYLV